MEKLGFFFLFGLGEWQSCCTLQLSLANNLYLLLSCSVRDYSATIVDAILFCSMH